LPYAIRPLSVLSVCPVWNVGVLWPNGWMDQDETWHAGRPLPWPHRVRWGPSAPSPKGHSPLPQFSAYICCGQMAGWIKMPPSRELGLDPSNIVLDGDLAPPPQKGALRPIFGPCLLWPNGSMDQDATWHGGRPRPRPHCGRWDSAAPPQKRAHSPQFSAHVYCGQTAGWIKMPLGMKVGFVWD